MPRLAPLAVLLLTTGLAAGAPASASSPSASSPASTSPASPLSPLSTDPAPTEPVRSDAVLSPGRRVMGLLVEIDRRLDLGTSPDGSGLWLERMATALEAEGRGSVLRLRLAGQLRGLAPRGLVDAMPPELVGSPATSAVPGPVDGAWNARLEHVLTSAERLRSKLEHTGDTDRTDRAQLGSSLAATTCASADAVSLGTTTGTTDGAAPGGPSSCADTDGTPAAWVRFTAPATGLYAFDTLGSELDTVLSLHSACPGEPGSVELACNDDAGDDLHSLVHHRVEAGQEVWVRVSGYQGGTGAFALTVGETAGIAGVVTREGSGEPLAGARVSLFGAGPTTDHTFDDLVATTETDADGSWTLGGLDLEGMTRDAYHLWVAEEGSLAELWNGVPCPFLFTCDLNSGTPIVAPSSGTVDGYDVPLSPGAVLSGTVTDALTGEPVEGLVSLVEAGTEPTRFLDGVVTASDGTYRIGGLPPGDVQLRVFAVGYGGQIWDGVPCEWFCDSTAGTTISITSAAELSGYDFALERWGGIAGTLTDARFGQPLVGEPVVIHAEETFFLISSYTGHDGSYRFDTVPPGSYFVRSAVFDGYRNEVWDDVPCPRGCDVTAGTPVTVSASTTTEGIDLGLEPLGAITGRVVDALRGTTLWFARVDVHHQSGQRVASAGIGPDGSYLVTGLEPGRYTVAALLDGYETQLWDGLACPAPCDPTTGTPVETAVGTVNEGIDFQLTRLGRIAGTVRFKRGIPTSANEPELFLYPVSGGFFARVPISLEDGTFLSQPLRAGEYRLLTAVPWYRDELYDDIPCPTYPCDVPLTSGKPVTVTNGTTTAGLDFLLDRQGILEVTAVSAETGDPLGGTVAIYDGTPRFAGSGTLDAQGVALITGVEPGAYSVRFVGRPGDSHQAELWGGVPCEPLCDLSTGTPVPVALNGDVIRLTIEAQPCPFDTLTQLSGKTFHAGTVADEGGCEELTAKSTVVRPGAEVTLRAGRSVVFGDGFRVEAGGTLEVGIEPSWRQPD